MTSTPGKAPKKTKEPRQSEQDRLEAVRYNHMMYGPTAGELKLAPKKIDYGTSYLKHPKFQSLITAFKRGAAFKFDIVTNGMIQTISTEESRILFDGKLLCYARSMNKHMDNLFLERATLVQLQSSDAAVHLVFAVLKALPELGEIQLVYTHRKFSYGSEILEFVPAGPGTNLLVGAYTHAKVHEKPKKEGARS